MEHGSDDTFSEQVLALLPRLRAYARSLSRDATFADDLVQDAVVRAWAARDRFVPGSNMEAWLVTILRNAFLSDRRKRSREVEDPEGAHTATLTVHASQPSTMEFQDTLAALQRLPFEQREALLLVAASGFSYQEAATICGVAEGTIKSRVSRARAHLEELLAHAERPAPGGA